MSLSFEVILVGESGVGKTSILNKYNVDTFNENEPATNGSSWMQKDVKINDKKIIHLDIWDTAGDKKYRALAKQFFKNKKVFIFVYDITKKETFEEIKNYWVNETGANVRPTDKSKQKFF